MPDSTEPTIDDGECAACGWPVEDWLVDLDGATCSACGARLVDGLSAEQDPAGYD